MDNETTETAETTEVTETTEKETGGGLRKQLESALAEVKDLKADKLTGGITAIGLDPTNQLGKAIAKEYDGEVSQEAIAAYAKEEYGYEKAAAESHPQAGIITEGHAQLDTISEGAGSVPVSPTESEALAKAEAEGDYQTTMAIKGAQVARQFQGR